MLKHALICLYAALRLLLLCNGCSSEMTTVRAIRIDPRPVAADTIVADSVQPDPRFQALVQDALQLYRQQDYTPAVDALREAVALRPNHWEPYYVLGLVRTATGDFPLAEAFLGESLDLAPPDNRIRSQIYLARAASFEAQARYGSAEQSYRTALQLRPKSHAAREGLRRLAERTAR